MRRISLAVDLSSSHVVLLHARAHDYLAFCVQGDRGQLRPFAAVLPCLCLCASLLFADPLALFPASVLSPPLTRRADLVPSSCALPSLPRARPLGCPTAAFGGATAALTPAEFAGSRTCRLPAPSATCLSMTCWWALASIFVQPKAAKPCFAGFFAWSIASLQRARKLAKQRARKLAKRRGSRGARFVVREAIRVSSQ